MYSLGSEQRPVVVKVATEEKAEKVAQVCERYGFHFIMGLDWYENLSDLKKALKERLAPGNVYDPCPCDSGKKYKFCCAEKVKNFNLDEFIAEETK